VGWLAWRDRRVLALLLATRPTTRSACVGHVTSRPTVSRSTIAGFLVGSLRGRLRILLCMSYFKLKILVLGVSQERHENINNSKLVFTHQTQLLAVSIVWVSTDIRSSISRWLLSISFCVSRRWQAAWATCRCLDAVP
jgi:hypothetical protein